MFVINPPERFDIKNTEVVNYNGKIVSIKFQYLNFNDTQELSLDTTISEILMSVKSFVKKNDNYDDKTSMLKLVYRGKVLVESKKLGCYVSGKDLIQVFKTLKPT